MTFQRTRLSWNERPGEPGDDDATNSSLVFGNDRTDETQRDVSNETMVDAEKMSGIFSPKDPQTSFQFGDLVGAADTQVVDKSHFSPLTFKRRMSERQGGGLAEEKRTRKNSANFSQGDTSRAFPEEVLTKDSQKDTQIINKGSSERKAHPESDKNSPPAPRSQLDNLDTLLGDTQVVAPPHSNQPSTTPAPWNSKLVSDDTQPPHETQVLQTLPENHDTQVVRPHLPGRSEFQTLPSALTNTLKLEFHHTPSTSSPQLEDMHQSRTQVMHTQEPSDEPPVKSSTKVVSSSQRSLGKEEIQSEDEWSYLHVDDTLELRQKLRQDSPETIPSSPTVPNRNGRHLRAVADTQSDGKRTQSCTGTGTENVRSQAEKTQPDNLVLRQESLHVIRDAQMVNKNSVWAAYDFRMYVGQVVSRGPHDLSVQFEDDIYTIKNSELHLLDVRVGDKLRIRSSPHEYLVCGLMQKEGYEGISCVRGYSHVVLQKVSKKSTPEITVELDQCAMELPEWILHQQKFSVITDSSTALTTPRRRVREDLSVASHQPLKKTSDMFLGCLFCLTNIGKAMSDQRRVQLRNLVETNGGTLLEDGFEELFTYNKDESGLLIGCHQLDGYHFAALVSNSYGRSAKYLQALSLGWPIVTDSFISDCVNSDSRPDSWPAYLLPAGQSKKTNSVKSIDVYQFRRNYEKGHRLSNQLGNNRHLLKGYHILFVDNKTNHKNRDTCEFIFHAFGAKSLSCILGHGDGNVHEHRDPTQSRLLVYDNSGEFKPDNLVYGVVDWEWVVQCVISGYVWEPTSFRK